MIDIKLDTTHDVDLSTGTVQLVEGNDAIAQRLKIRLRFFLGEWFLDAREGIPYYQKILGKKRSKTVIDSIFKRVILETPGVAKLDSFTQEYDGVTRGMSISFVAVAENGEPLVIDEIFTVG